MKVSLFDYHLPQELIAQEPLPERDESRLLVVRRVDGTFSHHRFYELPSLLPEGTFLVVNDTRVIPARLWGERPTGGKVEVFLVRREGDGTWRCLVRPGKRMRPGDRVLFATGRWWGEVREVLHSGERLMSFHGPGGLGRLLDEVGQVPLPPYIRRRPRPEDRERYQTVFASKEGAVAAPTAGLHFTPRVLDALKRRGIEILSITLHVGPGTFRPVKVEEVEAHRMEEEYYEISPQVAAKVEEARREGRRLLAVGTTVTRALESAADEEGRLMRLQGWTDLFIYPGYRFKVVDVLLTNFHLPRSTLLMLVCAFGGRELVMEAYREAVEERYRF
ncbi:MAG: tRNA preQ1(34) S-adenosylmethionine ribosyltransferase-isomerase QueA, partial [Aquificota bacterium]